MDRFSPPPFLALAFLILKYSYCACSEQKAMISNGLFYFLVIIFLLMLHSYIKPYLTNPVFLFTNNPCGDMFIFFKQLCGQQIF